MSNIGNKNTPVPITTVQLQDGVVTLAKMAAESKDAANFTYSGANSGVSATTVQGAIDENVTNRGHIFGLTLSNNSTDSNNDIDIAIGEAASDDTSPALIILSSTITKRLDASWSVGTGNGGLDTGSKTNSTWYYVWLIRRSDTGVVDVLFSASPTTPTMPTNYNQKRRIGFVFVNSSGNIDPFVQFGDTYIWGVNKSASTTLSDTNVTTRAVAVPPIAGIEVNIQGYVFSSTGFSLWIDSGYVENVVPGISTTNRATLTDVQANTRASFQKKLIVNSGGAFSARTNAAPVSIIYWTESFTFDRRLV